MTPEQQEFYRNLGSWLLRAGAGGAAVGGLVNMGRLISNNLHQAPEPEPPTIIKIPFRPDAAQSEPKIKQRLFKSSSILDEIGKWFSGGYAHNMSENPMTIPGYGLGTIGAIGGGYLAADKILGALNRRLQQRHVDDAKEDFENSLLKQFKPLPGHRVALNKESEFYSKLTKIALSDTSEDNEFTELISDLNSLADKALEKKANYWDFAAAPTAGLYATLMAPLAAATGLGTYYYTRQFDPNKVVLDKLKEQRALHRAEAAPDVYAQLVPVDEKNEPLSGLNKLKYDLGELQKKYKS